MSRRHAFNSATSVACEPGATSQSWAPPRQQQYVQEAIAQGEAAAAAQAGPHARQRHRGDHNNRR